MLTPNERFDLSGRVAVVTGGSRGLGRAMVEGFAVAGADVVIASRKLDACEEAAAAVAEATGRRALAIECHVGDWDQCDALVDRVYDEFGRMDVLVNNAGMSPLYDRLDNVTQALWEKVMQVNLQGPFRLSAYGGQRMYDAGSGSIINVSSVAAVGPTPVEVPYGAAKAGLNNLTKGFARAYGPRVRVNCIMPGPFLTDISKAWDMEAFDQSAKRQIPMQRGGEADEVVGAALLLAGDAGSYTTGAIIKIDGGLNPTTG